MLGKVFTILWAIWFHRNNTVFKNNNRNPIISLNCRKEFYETVLTLLSNLFDAGKGGNLNWRPSSIGCPNITGMLQKHSEPDHDNKLRE